MQALSLSGVPNHVRLRRVLEQANLAVDHDARAGARDSRRNTDR
jgi:hypothetical protein